MQALMRARWVLLGAAFAAGAGFTALALFDSTSLGGVVFDVLFPLIGVVQAAGVFAAVAHRKQNGRRGGWAAIVGYLAALAWIIGFISAEMAHEAGPGGIVYGLLITLPAIYLGPLLQAAALVLFRARERAAAKAGNGIG